MAFYVEKWSNGLRISSDPVTEEEPYNFDRSVLVPSGSAEFARVPQSSLGELSRLACLVLDKKVKAQSPQDKARVTGYIERIKKTMS